MDPIGVLRLREAAIAGWPLPVIDNNACTGLDADSNFQCPECLSLMETMTHRRTSSTREVPKYLLILF